MVHDTQYYRPSVSYLSCATQSYAMALHADAYLDVTPKNVLSIVAIPSILLFCIRNV